MDEDRVLAAIVELRSTMTAEIAELRSTMTAEIADLRANTASALVELRTTMMSRFERIEDRLTTIGDDITVNMSAAGAAMERTESLRREVALLGNSDLALHRLIKRLQTDVDDLRKRA